MNVIMTFEELAGLLADYTQIGFMEAVRAYEPARDNLRMAELKSWLKFMHVDNRKFKALVANGSIKAKRKGTSKNSPIYFSKKEIIEKVKATKVSSVVTKSAIRQELQ